MPPMSHEEFSQLLTQCGVTDTTLTRAERTGLDQQGYLVLPDAVDANGLELLRAGFEDIARAQEQTAKTLRSGTRHIKNLVSQPLAFGPLLTHPRVLAVVAHILVRPFRTLLFNGRDPLPGYGLQGLHQDWPPRHPAAPFSVATALWLLDETTRENGATRVVPGSHLWPKPLSKPMRNPQASHPDQKLVLAPAGAVLVFNGHLYHGGTRNQSPHSRRVVQCQFVAREMMPPSATSADLPPQLTAAARTILGG